MSRDNIMTSRNLVTHILKLTHYTSRPRYLCLDTRTQSSITQYIKDSLVKYNVSQERIQFKKFHLQLQKIGAIHFLCEL